MKISEIIKDKNILLVPVLSMRSYETGKYNLMADGNVSRIVSKLYESDFKSATILIPDEDRIDNKGELERLMRSALRGKNVRLLSCAAFGNNAHETRTSKKFFSFLCSIGYEEYDVVLVEPNQLAMDLLSYHFWDDDMLDKFVFWCPVSKTTGFTPSFIEEFDKKDMMIAKFIKTAVATQSQAGFLKGKSFVDETFYNAEAFDYKTVFFPFRLSDPCYKAKEVKDVLTRLKSKYNFKVLYTDPNQSGVFDDDDLFVRVPSQKEVYIQILKSRPIIPYFENSDDVLHISIFEFMYYGCDVIMLKNNNKTFENISQVSNMHEFEVELEKRLKRGE